MAYKYQGPGPVRVLRVPVLIENPNNSRKKILATGILDTGAPISYVDHDAIDRELGIVPDGWRDTYCLRPDGRGSGGRLHKLVQVRVRVLDNVQAGNGVHRMYPQSDIDLKLMALMVETWPRLQFGSHVPGMDSGVAPDEIDFPSSIVLGMNFVNRVDISVSHLGANTVLHVARPR